MWGSVKAGQTVEITADAVEGETFTGTVTNVSLEGSYSNGVTNYPVTVTLEETGDLLPGMNVDATIILDSAQDALCIPAGALMRGNRVYVKKDPSSGQTGPRRKEQKTAPKKRLAASPAAPVRASPAYPTALRPSRWRPGSSMMIMCRSFPGFPREMRSTWIRILALAPVWI